MSSAISPELSALGIRKSPSPAFGEIADYIKLLQHAGEVPQKPKIVDVGCGQLRHAQYLVNTAGELVLVDTPRQLNTVHDFAGERRTIPDFVAAYWKNKNVTIFSSDAFAHSAIDADLALCINVLDATPPKTRVAILRSCRQNLAAHGRLIVVVPRNEIWTLRLCTPARRYQDGFKFRNRGRYTYFKNWSTEALRKLLTKKGFQFEADHSKHRLVTLVCSNGKQGPVR